MIESPPGYFVNGPDEDGCWWLEWDDDDGRQVIILGQSREEAESRWKRIAFGIVERPAVT